MTIDSLSPQEMRKARERFYAHRGNAKRRNIPFLMSFEEWITVWLSSGHYHEIGRARGKYCMARFGDFGAYEVGNVRIITSTANIIEWNTSDKKRAARRDPQWRAQLSDTQREKLRAAWQRRKAAIHDPGAVA